MPRTAKNGHGDACSYQRCSVPQSFPFDCLAITAPNPRASKAYLQELVYRVGGEGAGEDAAKEVLVLAVSDPDGVRIGSGGGTLNAILEIDQALRAAQDQSADNPIAQAAQADAGAGTGAGEGLAAARVLLVHSGGDSQRSPTQCVCGKAWSALNSCGNGGGGGRCNTPMDLLLDHLSRLFSGGGGGGGRALDPGTLVVTACDVMLLIPPEVAATADWSLGGQSGGGGGVAGLAIAADAAKYAPNHGVYCLDGGGGKEGAGKNGIIAVDKYLQKPSFGEAEAWGAFLPPHHPGSAASEKGKDGEKTPPPPLPEVAIDSGVVMFSGAATAALAGLAYSETFRGCTTRGVAGGAAALRLELYSDLLLALKTGASEGGSAEGLDAYLAGCGPALPANHALSRARRETWDALSGFPLGAMLLTGAAFVHLGTTPELMEMMTLRLPEFIEPYGLTARAASVVGPLVKVETDPPAVVVNSRLDGAGFVAGGAVVEHCRFDGDGWKIGAGSLISGVRSIKADLRLRLRSGMCLQQTDLTPRVGAAAATPAGAAEAGRDGEAKFVVSLFGARDDIKAHYKADRARVCGATWEAFLACAGATAEDVWEGIDEADRKLWSARLFPVLTAGHGKQDTDLVMWMQDIHGGGSGAVPAAVAGGTADAAPRAHATSVAAAKWLWSERLSFKEILARADPGAEFGWRRHLEAEMAAIGETPASGRGGGEGEEALSALRGPGGGEGVGGGRYRAEWDVVVVVIPTMEHLLQAEAREFSNCPPGTGPLGANEIFTVPPPRPFFPAETTTTRPPPPDRRGSEWDGPLALNALLVAAERYSALERARFGSETSADALRGMRVLLLLPPPQSPPLSPSAPPPTPTGQAGGGGVWVRQRDGSMFVLREESIAPLLELCDSDPRYQGLTYLGADNAIPAPGAPPGLSAPSDPPPTAAFDFFAAATEAAGTAPPERVELDDAGAGAASPAAGAIASPVDAVGVSGGGGGSGYGGGSGGGFGMFSNLLKDLDDKAAAGGEAGTPTGAAQALARIACRLYELADSLGGGGHRSGPGEHPDWQAAMAGLDTLRRLPGGKDWAPPAALPVAVATLKRLRERWLGVAGFSDGAASASPNPHLVVRCARHYERAAAVVVSAAVRTASLFVEPPPPEWGSPGAGDFFQEEEEVEGGATEEEEEVMEKEQEGVKEKQEEMAVRQRRQERERRRQDERISTMNAREQAMARHSQAHANHLKVVEDNARRTQQRMREEVERWQQQQQQQQQQGQQQRQQALPVGARVTSKAAARIDLAGGWTDTPPISYEAGGSVVNAAVTVSGERPVEACCERIEARKVELVCVGADGRTASETVCSSLGDFADFCVPQAPAALLKAALICAGIVNLPPRFASFPATSTSAAAAAAATAVSVVPTVAAAATAGAAAAVAANVSDCSPARDTVPGGSPARGPPPTLSLEEQLARVFGVGGLRITSRSGLPQGSGMGTSSILAGVVLSAACVAAGRAMSSTSLVHAVLRVEQLMTAGGGHQDQVGGLLGGVKICRTAASLPLQVLTETIPLDPDFEAALNARLVLVYTGKQRLARDLLQGVVRGWHDRLPATVNTVQGLVANAEEAANACRGTGDLEALGRCLTSYWEQKKRMTPGAEPPAVEVLLDKLRPLCHGVSVCGAGGGGFMACITKSPGDQGIKEVTDALATTPPSAGSSEASTIRVHRGQLDPVGMMVSVELPNH